MENLWSYKDVRNQMSFWRRNIDDIVSFLIANKIKEYYSDKKTIQIFDLQCGNGETLLSIIQNCGFPRERVNIIGIDSQLDEKPFLNLFRRNGYRAEYICADLNDTELRSQLLSRINNTKNAFIFNIHGIVYLSRESQEKILKTLSNKDFVMVTFLGRPSFKSMTKVSGSLLKLITDPILSIPRAGLYIRRRQILDYLEERLQLQIMLPLSKDSIKKIQTMSNTEELIDTLTYSYNKLLKKFRLLTVVKLIITGFISIISTYRSMMSQGGRNIVTERFVNEVLASQTDINCSKEISNGIGFYYFKKFS